MTNVALKFVFLYAICSSLGCQSINKPLQQYNVDDSKSIVINLHTGVDSILVGVSTFNEIESTYGSGRRNKIKHKSFTVENVLPNATHVLNYPELGMRFETHPQPFYKTKYVAHIIVLDSSFRGESPNGIGIGSSYADMTAELPQVSELMTWPDYDGKPCTRTPYNATEGQFSLPIFKCRGKKDSTNFIVEEIEFRN